MSYSYFILIASVLDYLSGHLFSSVFSSDLSFTVEIVTFLIYKSDHVILSVHFPMFTG